MKISASFWLKFINYCDGENPISDELQIPMDMYNLTAIPFKVGDQINLNIDDLYPAQLNEYKEEHKHKLVKDNVELRNLLHLKKIEIISANNYARFNNLNDGHLKVEYFCRIVDEK